MPGFDGIQSYFSHIQQECQGKMRTTQSLGNISRSPVDQTHGGSDNRLVVRVKSTGDPTDFTILTGGVIINLP
jgi:hypothetical protein